MTSARRRRRWVDALLAADVIDQPADLRFVAFSLGRTASAMAHGATEYTRGFLAPPVWPTGSPPPEGDAPLVAASRDSGVVAVTPAGVWMLRARTAYSRPRPPAARAELWEVVDVRSSASDVALRLVDGGTARFCFVRERDVTRFVALW